jgi:hypothetical protein
MSEAAPSPRKTKSISRRWRSRSWYVIDERKQVRAHLKGFLRSEARRTADLMFGEGEDFKVVSSDELFTEKQRAERLRLLPLTPQKCADLLGIPKADLLDTALRDDLKAKLRDEQATLAPCAVSLPGETRAARGAA